MKSRDGLFGELIINLIVDLPVNGDAELTTFMQNWETPEQPPQHSGEQSAQQTDIPEKKSATA